MAETPHYMQGYTQPPQPNALDQDVVNLAKAIRQVETGNRPVQGASGELASRYQFMPATWKGWAKKYLGDENAELTLENENKVAYSRIKEWKDIGYGPDEIASMWNSGRPDWQGNVGTNKMGVKFDVPGYVKKVGAAYNEIKGAGAIPTAQAAEQAPEPAPEEPQQDGILKTLVKEPFKALFVRPATRFGQLAASAGIYAFGSEEQKRRADEMLTQPTELDIPIFGKYTIDPVKSGGRGVVQAVGEGLEAGSYLVGGGGATTAGKTAIKETLRQGLKRGVVEGAKSGAMFGLGAGLQEEETIGGIAKRTVADTALGAGLGAAFPLAGAALKGTYRTFRPGLEEAVNKGIKPYFSGKRANAKSRSQYMQRAATAVETINKHKAKLTGSDGVTMRRNPRTRAELLEAIQQVKSKIYKIYHDQAVKAGDVGAFFDPGKVMKNLRSVTRDIKYPKRIRQYAEELMEEIRELKGAAPDVVEARIEDLNQSLKGFYAGRTSKAQAQLDVSVAKLMREELDAIINQVTGKNYQALKNQYGALSTIEKDVARQVAVELRKNRAGLLDFTDIFTGGDLLAGVTTMNPALLLRGLTGRALKEVYKHLNNPNRYIKQLFKGLERRAGKATRPPRSVFGVSVQASKSKPKAKPKPQPRAKPKAFDSSKKKEVTKPGTKKVKLKELLDAEGDPITDIGKKIPGKEKSMTKGPIDIVKTEDGFMVLDGQHRVSEALSTGKETLDANVLSSKEALSKYGERWKHLEQVLGETKKTPNKKSTKPKAFGKLPKKPPQELAGGFYGIEMERDENGMITGVKFNEQKAIAGIAGLAGITKAKSSAMTQKYFKGLKNLSTKLLENFKGLPEEIKIGRFEEVLNKAKKSGIKEADEKLIRDLAEAQVASAPKAKQADPFLNLASKHKTVKGFEKELNVLYEDSWKGNKAKNADELKKTFEGYYFHGTNSADQIKAGGFEKGPYFNDGAYFAETPDVAIDYKNQNRGKGTGSEVFATKLDNLKIKDISYKDFRSVNKAETGGEELVEKLKRNRYDGIRDEYGEVLVWNVEKIKNPETLTDIFNKAKAEAQVTSAPKATSKIAQEAKKYKTAEEFVESKIERVSSDRYDWDTIAEEQLWNKSDIQKINLLKNKIKAGEEIPDILLFPESDEIFDGLHRAKAYSDLGKSFNGRVLTELEFDKVSDLGLNPSVEAIEGIIGKGKTKSQLTDIWEQAQGSGKQTINLTKLAEDAQKQLVPLKVKVSHDLGDLGGTVLNRRELRELADEGVFAPQWSNVGADFIGDGKYAEAVYQSPVKNKAGDVHYDSKQFPNYFSHVRYEDKGATRKILETQSDLFQKENFAHNIRESNPGDLKALKELAGEKGLPKEMEAQAQKIEALKKYSTDTASHLRTFREEVRRAAKDKKTRLLLPDGETAMKIEGLGRQDRGAWRVVKPLDKPEGNLRYEAIRDLSPENIKDIKPGQELDFVGDIYIFTEDLGEGRFRAIQESKFKKIKELANFQGYSDREIIEQALDSELTEAFDISGNIKKDHFVYKLNEKALPKEARRMGLELTGKIQQDNGTWWEIKIPKERANMPVEAFGAVPIAFAGQGMTKSNLGKRKEE